MANEKKSIEATKRGFEESFFDGEFYKAFDIKTGDGMYVPEDERVKIW